MSVFSVALDPRFGFVNTSLCHLSFRVFTHQQVVSALKMVLDDVCCGAASLAALPIHINSYVAHVSTPFRKLFMTRPLQLVLGCRRLQEEPSASAVSSPPSVASGPQFSELPQRQRHVEHNTPPRGPAPSVSQRLLASRVGDVLPAAAQGATLLAAAGLAVGGGLAGNAISNRLEGRRWSGCHKILKESYGHRCDNVTNDFWLPFCGAVPEFAAAAVLVCASPTVNRWVQSHVDAARQAVVEHEPNSNV
jgi:hypothetical protein